MTNDPVTVGTDSGIFDVLRAMRDAEVRRIPAVDEAGRLDGIVTFDDFVVLLAREFTHLGDVVEAEIPPYEHSLEPPRCVHPSTRPARTPTRITTTPRHSRHENAPDHDS